MPILKYDHTDTGFCKVHFTYQREPRSAVLHYCVLDDGYSGNPDFKIMMCSPDGEPSHEVKLKAGVKFDAPTCGTELGEQVKEFLKKEGLLNG